MRFWGLLLVISFLALGCSNSGGGGGGTQAQIPDSILQEKPTGTPLTVAQKAELKSDFQNSGLRNIVSLAYRPANESDYERSEREKKIAQATPDQKRLLSEVEARCQIQQPQEELQEMPSESVGAEGGASRRSAISGAGCPIRHEESNSYKSTITQIEGSGESKVVHTSTQANSFQALSFVSQDWVAMMNMVAHEFKLNLTAVSKWSREIYESHFVATGDMSYVLRNGTRVPATFRSETLIKQRIPREEGAPGAHSEQTQMVGNLQKSFGSVQLLIRSTRLPNGTNQREIFLNSEALTEAQYREIFGDTF